jgi:serine/threonine protein kinase
MTEETLFELAVNTPEAERAALLDRECAGDPALRARVEALLRADGRTLAFAPAPTRTVDPDGTRSLAAHETVGEAGQVVAGRYTLVEVIGEGGMGSVWRAKQTEPVKRFVAVKLIKAGMDTKAVLARFEAKRQALALMDHPNIAKILDGGVHENRPFFVMELVKGTPITDFCDARKLTPQQRLELFVPVCNAIQHAHQKGIIHRDIKPSNVMIALYDDKPVVKVIDFGVAKATGGALTEHSIDTGYGGVVGTPQYMSPEQATFNNLDRRPGCGRSRREGRRSSRGGSSRGRTPLPLAGCIPSVRPKPWMSNPLRLDLGTLGREGRRGRCPRWPRASGFGTARRQGSRIGPRTRPTPRPSARGTSPATPLVPRPAPFAPARRPSA